MKKIYSVPNVLIYIGFSRHVFEDSVQPVSQIHAYELFTITDICFLVGAILLPVVFVADNKFFNKGRLEKKNTSYFFF